MPILHTFSMAWESPLDPTGGIAQTNQRSWWRGPHLPKYGARKHFACAVGAAWVASIGAAFYFGQTYLGHALGGSMVVAAAVPTITDFCIPSFVWGLIFGKPAGCPLVGEG